MSIATLALGEGSLGAQQMPRTKSTKAPTRRQYVVKSDAAVAPEAR